MTNDEPASPSSSTIVLSPRGRPSAERPPLARVDWDSMRSLGGPGLHSAPDQDLRLGRDSVLSISPLRASIRASVRSSRMSSKGAR
jgi:hypothetical protein